MIKSLWKEEIREPEEKTIEELIEIAEKPKERIKEIRELQKEIRELQIIPPGETLEKAKPKSLKEEYKIGKEDPCYAHIERRGPEWNISVKYKKNLDKDAYIEGSMYILGGFISSSLKNTYGINYTIEYMSKQNKERYTETKGKTFKDIDKNVNKEKVIAEAKKIIETIKTKAEEIK